jgi:hypothetical protein
MSTVSLSSASHRVINVGEVVVTFVVVATVVLLADVVPMTIFRNNNRFSFEHGG